MDQLIFLDQAGRRIPRGAIDSTAGMFYWTRNGPPNGGAAPQALADDLGEAIGIAIGRETGRMFVTALQGDVVSMKPDGADRHTIVENAGRLTGICYHRLHE